MPKLKFLCWDIQKLYPERTHRQYENITFPHMRAVIMWSCFLQFFVFYLHRQSIARVIISAKSSIHFIVATVEDTSRPSDNFFKEFPTWLSYWYFYSLVHLVPLHYKYLAISNTSTKKTFPRLQTLRWYDYRILLLVWNVLWTAPSGNCFSQLAAKRRCTKETTRDVDNRTDFASVILKALVDEPGITKLWVEVTKYNMSLVSFMTFKCYSCHN